jgi:hypothetical protein
LNRPDREDDQAGQNQMHVRALRFGAIELRDHIPVVKDWSRDQIRKVADEQHIMRQRVVRDVASIGLDQERDLGKGVAQQHQFTVEAVEKGH